MSVWIPNSRKEEPEMKEAIERYIRDGFEIKYYGSMKELIDGVLR